MNTLDTLTLGLRMRAAFCFLTSALALAVVSLFALVDAIRPALEGLTANSDVIQEMLAAIYPFALVNEVRLIYGGLLLMPVLIPLLSSQCWAVWLTLILAILLTLINIQDALFTFVQGGKVLFGWTFVVIVGAPAVLGMLYVWRWRSQLSTA